MRHSCQEMQNGVSEGEAIRRFGVRCIIPEIKKFASLHNNNKKWRKNRYTCLKLYGWKARNAMWKFFTDERGEVNVVAIVVLIAVAVVLALLFKDQIANQIKTLIGNITTKANTALDPV